MSDQFDLERYGVIELSARWGGKWAREGDRVLAAWIADMDFPIAPPIRDTLIEMIGNDDLGYPDEATFDEVRDVFARRMMKRHGLVLEPARIVVTQDVVQAIALSLLALTNEGDGVLFFTPSYPPFFAVIESARRRQVPFALAVGQDGYRIDFTALRDLIATERPQVLLLCSPHNPTGRVFTDEELEAIGELVVEFDLVVLSDEIHSDLVLPSASHRPIATVSKAVARRCVTLSSASKAFNIAGLRCAVASFGSDVLLDAFNRFPAQARGGVSTIGMHAAITAWNSGDPWREAVIGYLDRNRMVVRQWAETIPGLVHFSPEATYLAWMDFTGTGLGDDPAAVLHDEAGVALSPGIAFGQAGRGHVRLNFATPRPILDELLDRMGSAIARLA